jgi:hypothetical protein
MAKYRKNLNENFLDKFFGLFIKAKSKGKEIPLISRIREKDPELADLWADWDETMDKILANAKKDFEYGGKSEKAKEVDALINKYRNM